MKFITVKIPENEKKKWSLSFGHKPRLRNSATVIFNAIKRHCLASQKKGKTCVRVLEHIDGHWENVNESIASDDSNYLIYVTACFLEDYLSDEILKKTVKEYGRG